MRPAPVADLLDAFYTEPVARVVQIAISSSRGGKQSSLSPSGASLLAFPELPKASNPLVLWHLLSLDAPTVAGLWTWFLASANGLRLPWVSVLAMVAAVWLLYAGDRLMDSRVLAGDSGDASGLEARHRFHHRHRRAFRLGIAAVSLLLATTVPFLPTEAIHLYLIEGSFLAGYFLLIHTAPGSIRVPKEFAVGLFFAAATFIPTVARWPELRVAMLAPAILFAALCSLNCLFIYAWEHPPAAAVTAHVTTRIALKHLRALGVVLLLAALSLTLSDAVGPWTIPAAIALSTGLLLALHQCRRFLPPTTLRAAADLTLLTPFLFFFL